MMTACKHLLCSLITGLTLIACGPGAGDQKAEFKAPSIDPCALNAPVCGANGKTYANQCQAQQAGITITSFEPCGCSLSLTVAASESTVAGTWSNTAQWPVQLTLSNGDITRVDYINQCNNTICAGAEQAVSTGTYHVSGPIIHLKWTNPTLNSAVELPPLLLYENTCEDGDIYLVEMAYSGDYFYGKE